MRLGVRGKLFLLSLGLIALSLLASELYLAEALDRWLVERIHQGLVPRLQLVKGEVEDAVALEDNLLAWDELADKLGRRAQARATLIAVQGTVLGDSELEEEALRRVENHAHRPEVASALAGRVGKSIRHSSTVGHRMMYVAAPFSRNETPAGVVRLAVPLTEVDRTLSQARGIVLLAGLVALGLAVVMSTLASELASRAVRSLTETAGRMAGGDLAVRTRPARTDELGQLGAALDGMASRLDTAMRELRADRDLLQGILDGMQEGVLVLDGQDRIVGANTAMSRMLLKGGARGQPLLEGIRHAELKSLLDRARTEGAIGEIERHFPTRSHFLVHATPLGENLLAVFMDVTELRRMESVRRDFVANVSHELRTPLTSLLSSLETLSGGALRDPEAAGLFLEILERNARRMHRLVEDLLDLSALESGARRLQLEELPLVEVAGAVIESPRVELEVPGDLIVQADLRALEQVLSNLVHNALKFSEGPVTVRAERQQGWALVSVIDRGPGIEKRHLSRLFERFYRVDEGRSRELGGTGLGLSIARRLVEAQGGRIEVESAPGRGSTFSFTLSCHQTVTGPSRELHPESA